MKNTSFCLLVLHFLSCDWPFDTEDTGRSIFGLKVSFEAERIVDSAAVELTWDPVSVEHFSHYRIERKVSSDIGWVLVNEIDNVLEVSYKDYIKDDEDLDYRVGIMDNNNNVLWATGSVSVPQTTKLYVPDEWLSPAQAFQSPLIDDGDSILVNAGEYVDTLSMVGKSVYVSSVSSSDQAVLLSRVVINTGTLKGFIIRDAVSSYQNGGGIYISGNGRVLNCIIRDNYSGRNAGGVYLREQAELYNSIVFNNASSYGSMNLYAEKASKRVINNTFVLIGDSEYGKNVTVSELQPGFEFLNNIIFGAETFSAVSADSAGITIDYCRMDRISISGDSIITADPEFVRLDELNPDFQLAPGSPCVHAGHPDTQYNNVDGTRNSMGAYGGPGGEDN